jgi:hypothetical protein
VIRGNSSSFGGGGMLVIGTSTLRVANSIVADNDALSGGGIYADSVDDLEVINCTIADNNGGSGSGGGIYLQLNTSSLIANCIAWANTASTGAQIHSAAGTSPTVTFS